MKKQYGLSAALVAGLVIINQPIDAASASSQAVKKALSETYQVGRKAGRPGMLERSVGVGERIGAATSVVKRTFGKVDDVAATATARTGQETLGITGQAPVPKQSWWSKFRAKKPAQQPPMQEMQPIGAQAGEVAEKALQAEILAERQAAEQAARPSMASRVKGYFLPSELKAAEKQAAELNRDLNKLHAEEDALLNFTTTANPVRKQLARDIAAKTRELDVLNAKIDELRVAAAEAGPSRFTRAQTQAGEALQSARQSAAKTFESVKQSVAQAGKSANETLDDLALSAKAKVADTSRVEYLEKEVADMRTKLDDLENRKSQLQGDMQAARLARDPKILDLKKVQKELATVNKEIKKTEESLEKSDELLAKEKLGALQRTAELTDSRLPVGERMKMAKTDDEVISVLKSSPGDTRIWLPSEEGLSWQKTRAGK